MGLTGVRKMAVVGFFVAVTTVLSGCYGQFALVRALYKVNGSVENKWARSGVTALLVILPVYAFAGLGDVIVVNPIEFWSHVNPITNKPSVSSSRTQGIGVDPTKTSDGWLSRNDKAGNPVLLAWHYDSAGHSVHAIKILRGEKGAGKPSVTLYRSRLSDAGRLGSGVRINSVTFKNGVPQFATSGGMTGIPSI